MRTLLRVVLIPVGCVAVVSGAELVQEHHLPSGRTMLILAVVFFILTALAVIPASRHMPRERPWTHFRPTVVQVTLPGFAAAWIALGVVAILTWHAGNPLSPDEFRDFAISAVSWPVMGLVLRDKSVILTPGRLIARSGLYFRLINWSEVRNVAVERQLGVRTVVIRDMRGRRTTLNAPWGFLDRDFDAKVEVIRACWLGQHDWGRYPTAAVAR